MSRGRVLPVAFRGGRPDWDPPTKQYPEPGGGGGLYGWERQSMKGAMQITAPPGGPGDFTKFQTWFGSPIMFNIVFATGETPTQPVLPGWKAGWKLKKEEAWYNIENFLENSGYIVGTDRTIIISQPLIFVKTRTLNSAGTAYNHTFQTLAECADTNVNDPYWFNFGYRVAELGVGGKRSDGRPKLINRTAWEASGEWYPHYFGNSDADARAHQRACDRAKTQFDAGYASYMAGVPGGDTSNFVFWDWNLATGKSTKARIELARPRTWQIYTTEAYDSDYAYVAAWNAGKRPGTAEWQAVRQVVWNSTYDYSVPGGIRHVAELAFLNGKMFGTDEGGNFTNIDAGKSLYRYGGYDNTWFIQKYYDEMNYLRGLYNNLAWIGFFERDSGTEGNLHRMTKSSGGLYVPSDEHPLSAALVKQLLGA